MHLARATGCSRVYSRLFGIPHEVEDGVAEFLGRLSVVLNSGGPVSGRVLRRVLVVHALVGRVLGGRVGRRVGARRLVVQFVEIGDLSLNTLNG
jgi:hypothetical protein